MLMAEGRWHDVNRRACLCRAIGFKFGSDWNPDDGLGAPFENEHRYTLSYAGPMGSNAHSLVAIGG
jgi:hypothetical protein